MAAPATFLRVPSRRPLLAWAIVTAVVLVLLALLVDWRVRSSSDATVHDRLQHGISSTLAAARRSGGVPDTLGAGATTRQLLDDGGEVLSGSGAAPDERLLSQGEVQRVGTDDLDLARSGGATRELGGGHWRVAAVHAQAHGQDVIAVAATDVELERQVRSTVRRWLVVVTALAWLALLGLATTLRRSTVAPVERLRVEVGRAVGRTRTRRLGADDAAGPQVAALVDAVNGVLVELDASRRRERTVVAATARELSPPVRALRQGIDGALARKRPAEQLRDILAELRPEVGRLEGLADDLGLIASGDARSTFATELERDAQQVPVRPVVDEVMAGVRADAGERVVRATVSTDASVRGNVDAVRRALDGLIRNALEHGDGDVVVTVEERGLLVRFEVRDDGPGFSGAALAAGPESLTRAEGQDLGRGLGLAVVVSVARAHGGDAGIDNATAPNGTVTGGIAWFALARRGEVAPASGD